MQMRKTIADYLTTTSNPLIDTTATTYAAVPDFIKNSEFLDVLEMYVLGYYGEYELIRRYQPDISLDPKDTAEIPTILTNMYAANAYMLAGLWESTQLKYNPIDNYNMVETGKDTNSGTDTTTDNLGATESTEKIGEKSDTTQYGNHTRSSVHDVSPENTQNFIPESRTTDTDQPHDDTFTAGEQTNIFNSNAVKNVSELQHGHVLEHELTRSGNIGVTTSQQMIQSERDLVNFSIYKVIGNLIITKIAKRVWNDF